jgi:ATP-dependent DNA helicase RecG
MDEHVSTIKGVGDAVAGKFRILGIRTIYDLVLYYPRRYEDYSEVKTIAKIKPDHVVTIKAVIKQATGRYVRRGMHITEAIASDDTGSMRLVWFNQPYRAAAIKPDQTYFISGSFELSRGKLAIMNPSMELESAFPVNTARIVPIYRETKGLKSATIRKAVVNIKDQIQALPDNLPSEIVASNDLMSHAEALLAMHFPESQMQLEQAKRRLGFEELFAITLASLLNKQQFAKASGVKIEFNEKLAQEFVANLPFSLTNAQRKVVWQIYKDLEANIPMNRLVEGDVGSGKTIVAVMAALMTIKQGYQVALLAPTEILARQHADTTHTLLSFIGMSDEVLLLVGSMKPAQKQQAHKRIADKSAHMIVGTHALIAEKVDLKKLGLVIVDEQHRFGVEQRKKLQAKAGVMPHVLSMTATPIPRTLALTLYGELDISILDELPPGRAPIITEIVSPNSRKQMYQKVEQELADGRQVFVVCPLISESETLQVLSAERVYEGLSQKVFKHRRVGLLHGKMKSEEKDAIMALFVVHELDILVSTTVIEVGVDIPNATIMIIEGAERFGLAQAHQLRGRVGRGSHQGYCYLVMSDSKPPSRRLRALQSSTNGFKLAELDLEIRGPGAIYGHIQSGQLDLRIANMSDVKLIAFARASAQKFIDDKEKLLDYPDLARGVKVYRSITSLN